MRHLYIVYGWLDTEHAVELGTFETNLSLKDAWEYIVQIFDDGTCKEGLYAKRRK